MTDSRNASGKLQQSENKKTNRRLKLISLLLVFCCVVFLPSIAAQKKTAQSATMKIDDAALRNADTHPGDWISHGRDGGETRFSPLKQINENTVGQLGLAWSFDTNTDRGLEATPIVVDGIMYATGSWSVVFAIDATTGKQIWEYDPQVSHTYGPKACCDAVNRGVAVYKGKVYVGALDGRLIALDAANGKVVWETLTVDQTRAYTITGAPRIAKGKVIIGNGGAEFGVRGYVSAYDAETGKLSWRFYTVPGDPSKPFESAAMEKAAKTWKGEWWKIGGGGTAWDSMVYDADLDLLYVGTGNGSPWNPQLRSPGGGDNLYLSCIVALKAETGELQWYYQTTPGDSWDYTATQHIILTDLKIGGQQRKVLMQAPKNGFFYILDRKTGELISAEPFVKISWAKGVDKSTGRPIENPGVRYENSPIPQQPGPLGAHNWQPMSYDPQTGLVYIPAQDTAFYYGQMQDFKYKPGTWNTGVDFGTMTEPPKELFPGHLLAWDPVAQKERWRVQYPVMWNGGLLSTAGNLVFQGTADGRFVAYSADKGAKLWEAKVGTGIIASPVTYQVGGVQYVSIMVGWGGSFPLSGGSLGLPVPPGRVLTFVLNGKQKLSAPAPMRMPQLTPIELNASEATIKTGAVLFARNCAVCHGISALGGGGVLPDLRFSSSLRSADFKDIVLNGALVDDGMPSFKQWLEPVDVEAIRAYVIVRRAELLPKK